MSMPDPFFSGRRVPDRDAERLAAQVIADYAAEVRPSTAAVRLSDLRCIGRTLGLRERDATRFVARVLALGRRERQELRDAWEHATADVGALRRRRRSHLRRLVTLTEPFDA